MKSSRYLWSISRYKNQNDSEICHLIECSRFQKKKRFRLKSVHWHLSWTNYVESEISIDLFLKNWICQWMHANCQVCWNLLFWLLLFFFAVVDRLQHIVRNHSSVNRNTRPIAHRDDVLSVAIQQLYGSASSHQIS